MSHLRKFTIVYSVPIYGEFGKKIREDIRQHEVKAQTSQGAVEFWSLWIKKNKPKNVLAKHVRFLFVD